MQTTGEREAEEKEGGEKEPERGKNGGAAYSYKEVGGLQGVVPLVRVPPRDDPDLRRKGGHPDDVSLGAGSRC